MIVALIIGRKGSKGWPNKNIYKINGKSLIEYPILTAKKSKYIDQIYISTDWDKIKDIAKSHNIEVIDRPEELCKDNTLTEDVLLHGFNEISKNEKVDIFIPLMGNCPTINIELLDTGIEKLLEDKSYDSAVSVSKYNMWSPLRAVKIENNLLNPYLDNINDINCDRNSGGDFYFYDNSIFVVKSRCMDYSNGILPYKWIGKKIYPLIQECGLDLDYKWQLSQAKYWIKKYGEI